MGLPRTPSQAPAAASASAALSSATMLTSEES